MRIMLSLSNTIYIVLEAHGLLLEFACEHNCLVHLKGATTKEKELAEMISRSIDNFMGQDSYISGEEGSEFVEKEDVAPAQKRAELLSTKPLEEQIATEKAVIEDYDKAVDSYKRHGGKSPTKRIQKKYGRVAKNIYKLSRDSMRGGSTAAKKCEVARYTLSKFIVARKEGYAIHDIHIMQWAAYRAAEISCSLRGSQTWVTRFKKQYGIVSRKVTKVISRANHGTAAVISSAADQFVASVSDIFVQTPLDHIWNTDQMGIVQEITSARTLEIVGADDVIVTARNVSATTHSYTVMPVITASGRLLPIVLVCLKERGGKIPATKKGEVEELVREKCTNIAVTASESGKLTASHITYFSSNCLMPSVQPLFPVELFLDPWSGHTNEELYRKSTDMVSGKEIRLKVIPPRTTSMIQPLDVGFNFYVKYVIKKISDKVKLVVANYPLHHRINTIKTLSLIFNQLAASCYHDMIRYA